MISKVLQLSYNKKVVDIYYSVNEASKRIGVSRSVMYNAINKGTRLKGYYWSAVHKVVRQHKGDTSIATFRTIAEASMATGINEGNINSVVNGSLLSAGGYNWEWVELSNKD